MGLIPLANPRPSNVKRVQWRGRTGSSFARRVKNGNPPKSSEGIPTLGTRGDVDEFRTVTAVDFKILELTMPVTEKRRGSGMIGGAKNASLREATEQYAGTFRANVVGTELGLKKLGYLLI
jgi:hypothetical protein